MRAISTLVSVFYVCVFLSATSVAWAQQELASNDFVVAAPSECLMFSVWDRQQQYDPNGNATEKLMSEPEVKAFSEELLHRVGLILPAMDAGGSGERYELLHKLGPKLVRILLTRGGCCFVESVELDEFAGPRDAQAAMMIDAGQDAEEIVEMLASVVGNESAQKKKIGGSGFVSIPISEDPDVDLYIGNSDNLLIVALGEKTVATMLQRIKAKQVPEFLTDFRSSNGIEKWKALSYFNVKSIRKQVVDVVGSEATAAFAFAGLGNATSIETCSGLGQQQWLSRVLIRLDGRPEGILDLASVNGLVADDLKALPKDSLLATGVSMDARRAFALIREAVSAISGKRDGLDAALSEFKRETGVNVQTDIIENLGSSFTLYNARSDGLVTGLTMTTSVKDPQALSKAAASIIKTVLMNSRNNRHYSPEFVQRKVGDHFVVSARNLRRVPLFSIEPSWSIANDRLVFGLSPQAVESALKRTPAEILVLGEKDAFMRESFVRKSDSTKLIGMAYIDAAANYEITQFTPGLPMLMRYQSVDQLRRSMPAKQARRMNAIFSDLQLPPARVMNRHLKPSLMAVRQTTTGIEVETSQTIPSLDVGQVTPLAVAALLPAVQATRAAARRSVSMNNIRQQVLASLNYESAHQRFPPGYTVDPEGNQLLSWRVYILPYIEQQKLYQQFKLDEPWDSPNNKPLIAQMPEVFRSPRSDVKPGMTVYRGIGGKSGVLQGAQGARGGLRIGQISDGTSNTIFVIETSDELAVPWTQPDQGIDPDNVEIAKLFGNYSGGTIVGMCDGSTHFMLEKIDANMLRIMMKMNDGQVVQWEGNVESYRRRGRGRTKDVGPIDPRFLVSSNVEVLKLEDMLNDADRAIIARDELRNKFRQIALAMHSFESAHAHFPSAYTTSPIDNADPSKSLKPLLSWRVHILPFLEGNDLYKQFKLDEPWDSDHNRALVEKMPSIYVVDPNASVGKTSIVGIGGKQGVIAKPDVSRRYSGTTFGQLSDGSSKTILLIDAGSENAVQWTKPTEFEPTAEIIQKLIGRDAIVAMADGSTWELRKDSVSAEFLKSLMTMSGGEVVSNDWQRKRK